MKVLRKIWVYLKPFTNLKFLISFGIAWMITNGWCYLFILFGSLFKINWMLIVGTTYAGILYLPFTIEKLITIPMAMWFQARLFPKDMKLRQEFIKMKQQAICDFKAIKYKVWCIYRGKRLKRLKMEIIGFKKGVYYERIKDKIYNW